ncbi:MAG: hypothetical protein SGPRY_006946, partial [Prymnesium sp.]
MRETVSAIAVERSRLGGALVAAQWGEWGADLLARRWPHHSAPLLLALEIYRASARLRLLSLSPDSLLASTSSEAGGKIWSRVVGRMDRDAPLRRRARQRSGSRETKGEEGKAGTRWLGEVLHATQPVVYLLLLLLYPRVSHSPLRARIPWLTALAMELLSLLLCSGGRGRERAVVTRQDEAELAHRRKLIALLLLRPAARATTRAILSRLSLRLHPASVLGGACALALELVDSLDSSYVYRYFSTCAPGV